MPTIRSLQFNFNGGEVTPEFFGRIDDSKYRSGAATMRNFIPLPHGPVANRPGSQFVREVRDSTKRTRIIPFVFSISQTFIVEMGAGYFRFHTQGATLLNAAGTAVYEIANPYAEADLFSITYVQSQDVLTLVHPNYAPRELRRLGATNWELRTVQFVSDLLPPDDVMVAATKQPNPTNERTYRYVVTSVGVDGRDESVKSAVVEATNNLNITGNYNTVTWTARPGVTRYNIYKDTTGLFGFVGQSETTSFRDDNIIEDFATTPPIGFNPFDAANKYPAAVSYYEQRRIFAGTNLSPQSVFMTRTGTESNFNYSIPSREDDGISFRIASREANIIRHVVPLQNLVLLTSSAEFRITSVNSDAITPTSISVKPQSYVGASNVQPSIINNNLVYCAARGGHVRELGFSFQSQGYLTSDLSLRAPHLFDNLTIVDQCFQKSPQPILWFVSSNGKLLGLTYVPEQQINAWHQHDTDGVFESCAVVAEGNDDALYVVVRRTINGVQRRYVERFAQRFYDNQAPADAFFVDAGATYSGAPTQTISGLGFLEGKTVSILADGAVHPPRTVAAGMISLVVPCSKVQIGLPFTSDLKTLPLAAQVDGGFGQGRQKNLNAVWLRVYRASGIFVGPSADKLTEAKQRTDEFYNTPPRLKAEEIKIVMTPSWQDDGQLFVRQADPLPLTILSATLEVAMGGG